MKAALNLMCNKCGRTSGPPRGHGDACSCGGKFEYMPEDILKGLGAFAPNAPSKKEGQPLKLDMFSVMLGAAALIASAYVMRRTPTRSK